MELHKALGLIQTIVETFRRENGDRLSPEQLAQLSDMETNIMGLVEEMHRDLQRG